MTKTPKPKSSLSLSIQYAVDLPRLPRWRVRRWVTGVLDHVGPAEPVELNLRFVDPHEARDLNRTYRHKDYVPNVLTFTYDDALVRGQPILGDIVICADVMEQEAHEQHKPFLQHACHLIVHGTLHALGYDHQTKAQAKEMESLEIEILKRWHIPNPYQPRTAPC